MSGDDEDLQVEGPPARHHCRRAMVSPTEVAVSDTEGAGAPPIRQLHPPSHSGHILAPRTAHQGEAPPTPQRLTEAAIYDAPEEGTGAPPTHLHRRYVSNLRGNTSSPRPPCRSGRSLVPRPTSQLRMDYITATRVVGLVSSCTNFCPVAPECYSDQSDLRYALIAYSISIEVISYGGKARDG